MKKLLTICLIMTTTFTLNAQTRPTKEETISWLQEKLSKYIVSKNNNYNNIIITATSCEIIIDYNTANYKWQMKVPTDEVIFTLESISTSGERITDQNITKGTSKVFKNSIDDFNLKEGETDLRARVKKALDHLATFCPKKKETF